MKCYEVAFCEDAEQEISTHLLQHFRVNKYQEDLCFALWRPATGKSRYTGLIYKAILPQKGERKLHGNVEFLPRFLGRAISLAVKEKAGLAFMHSHPSDGWQGMSAPDVVAERDVLSSPALATGLPLLGLTIGTDGYWSARFWKKKGASFKRHWCQKVRVVAKRHYKIYCNNQLLPPPKRKNILRRTFDTWGVVNQNNIARLKVGIVGLGSVGCIVAEAIARIGVANVVLIDPDIVEEHNLDRLLYGTEQSIGKRKVEIAAQAMKAHATAGKLEVKSVPLSIHDDRAYQAALDCDVLFSCVDRPVARDVLNFIAIAHLIPVIDGGVAITTNPDHSFSAHWRAHLVTPYHQCLRCNGQYSTSDVSMELDGSLDDPSYIQNLPLEQRNSGQNVFPFSLSVASMEINLLVRYLVAQDWWPEVQQQDYQFLTGSIRLNEEKCHSHCIFKKERVALGDESRPHYICCEESEKPKNIISRIKFFIAKVFG